MDSNKTKQAATVNGWHFIIALLGIAPIIYLATVSFDHLFTTAGDVLALISYIAAVIGAVFGVQIAVRGAEAAAENNANKSAAKDVQGEMKALETNVSEMTRLLRLIGESPAGTEGIAFSPAHVIKLEKKEEISPTQLSQIEASLKRINSLVNDIAT